MWLLIFNSVRLKLPSKVINYNSHIAVIARNCLIKGNGPIMLFAKSEILAAVKTSASQRFNHALLFAYKRFQEQN